MKTDELQAVVESELFAKELVRDVVAGNIIIVPTEACVVEVTNASHSDHTESDIWFRRLSDNSNGHTSIDPKESVLIAVLDKQSIVPLEYVKKGDVISFNLNGSQRGKVVEIRNYKTLGGIDVQWYDEKAGFHRKRSFQACQTPIAWLFAEETMKTSTSCIAYTTVITPIGDNSTSKCVVTYIPAEHKDPFRYAINLYQHLGYQVYSLNESTMKVEDVK